MQFSPLPYIFKKKRVMRSSSSSSSLGLLFLVVVFAATLLSSSTTEALDTSTWVNVYEGPEECDSSDKVNRDNYISVHYTGTIDESSETGEKGKQFDSSRDHDNKTFNFKVGGGEVIKGWDLLLPGLCKGAKATILIPPPWGYGKKGSGKDIPGGATLKFDLEIVDVQDKPITNQDELDNFFAMLDGDEDGLLSREEVDKFWKFQGKTTPEGYFEREDTNNDGYIDKNEFGMSDEEEVDGSKSEL